MSYASAFVQHLEWMTYIFYADLVNGQLSRVRAALDVGNGALYFVTVGSLLFMMMPSEKCRAAVFANIIAVSD